jgi:hypothetical protein
VNKATYGDRYCVLKFDDIVRETELTMTSLAHWLGISFDSILTVPTFNTISTPANSSFAVSTTGILSDAVAREGMLTEAERTYIEEMALPVYRLF